MIAVVVYDMGRGIVAGKNRLSIGIMLTAFAAVSIFGVNVVYVVLVCGLLGVIRTLMQTRRKKA